MLASMTTTKEKWIERVRQWQASGVGAEQFAQGKGYRPGTLVWYRTRLRREGLLEDVAGVHGSGAGRRHAGDCATKSQVDGAANGPRRSGKKAASSTMRGAPMPLARVVRSSAAVPQVDAVVIEIGLTRISVRPGFDAGLLQKVVHALQGAA